MLSSNIGLKPQWPAKIYEDNKAVIGFQNGITINSKVRGVINMRDGWVKELRNTKKVLAVKIPTDKNLADMMTKCYQPKDLTNMLRQIQQVDRLENI